MKLKNFNMVGRQLPDMKHPELYKEYLDQIQFEFLLEGVNRFQSMLICELKGSYVQQSQRYVEMDKSNIYYPSNLEGEAIELIEESFNLYKKMTELKGDIKGRPSIEDFKYGIPYEDARYILPLSVTTNIQVSLTGNQMLEFLVLMEKYQLIFQELLDSIFTELNKTSFRHYIDLKYKLTPFNGELFREIYNGPSLGDDNSLVILDTSENMTKQVGVGALTSTTKGSPLQKENSNLEKVVERVMGYGHTSIAEQATITSAMSMSLVTYHQFVRHRLGKNIRESFDNLKLGLNDFVIPPSIANSDFKYEFINLVNRYTKYRLNKDSDLGLLFLLNADTIQLINKTNARIDIEIAKERTCRNAQWEVRSLYEKKIGQLLNKAPTLFKNAVPPCVYGKCPEGALSCGQQVEVRDYYLGDDN